MSSKFTRLHRTLLTNLPLIMRHKTVNTLQNGCYRNKTTFNECQLLLIILKIFSKFRHSSSEKLNMKTAFYKKKPLKE